jgi:3-hydroxypropionyl-coenzyme A dehydratase
MGRNSEALKNCWSSKNKRAHLYWKNDSAEEAKRIGLVNRVVNLSAEEEERQPLPGERTTVTTITTGPSSTSSQEEKQKQQQEKQRVNELAKILNKKLIDESISLAKEITKNSFTAVKTSKILINK